MLRTLLSILIMLPVALSAEPALAQGYFGPAID